LFDDTLLNKRTTLRYTMEFNWKHHHVTKLVDYIQLQVNIA